MKYITSFLITFILISINVFATSNKTVVGHAYSECTYLNSSFIDPNFDPLYGNPDKNKNVVPIDPTRSIKTGFLVIKNKDTDQYELIINSMDLTDYGYSEVYFYRYEVDTIFQFGEILLGSEVTFDCIEDVDLSKCEIVY